MIIQAGSIDITNMKTGGDNIYKYSEFFHQQAMTAAENLFTEVANCLLKNSNVKQAVILKQTPRYDNKNVDPHSLKAALVKLYNDTLVQKWLESPLKNRIVIGNHELDCCGAIFEARYRNIKKKLFDGVHLFGSSGQKAYTESVLRILRDAKLIKHDPPKFFRRYCNSNKQDISQPQNTYEISQKSVFAVPTYNRYEALQQGN